MRINDNINLYSIEVSMKIIALASNNPKKATNVTLTESLLSGACRRRFNFDQENSGSRGTANTFNIAFNAPF